MMLGWVMTEAVRWPEYLSVFRPFEPYVIADNDVGETGMHVWDMYGERILILRDNCAFLPQGYRWWVIEPDEDIGGLDD